MPEADADQSKCRVLARCAGAGKIDAIIGAYAVQHTSIDTLPQQMLANKQFEKVTGDLEREPSNRLDPSWQKKPFRLPKLAGLGWLGGGQAH